MSEDSSKIGVDHEKRVDLPNRDHRSMCRIEGENALAFKKIVEACANICFTKNQRTTRKYCTTIKDPNYSCWDGSKSKSADLSTIFSSTNVLRVYQIGTKSSYRDLRVDLLNPPILQLAQRSTTPVVDIW